MRRVFRRNGTEKRPTSNVQRSTFNNDPSLDVECWALNVERSLQPPESILRRLLFVPAPIRHFVFRLLSFVFTLCALALPAVRADDTLSPQALSAIDRGLEFLAGKQQPNGMYPCNLSRSTAITSLATMAFLARGHVPGQGPYGATVNRSIDFLLASQRESGLLSLNSGGTPMYDHGISTMMLCEAYGMVDPPRRNKIDAAVAKAVKLIIDAQRVPKDANDQGGWRYRTDSTDSDISVSGWQLMALRGAANIGAAVPRQCIADGVAYIRRRATITGGFSYCSAGGARDSNAARTGTGILSLELLGEHESREALAGGDYLLRAAPGRREQHYYYALYYCTQAAHQLGGKYWTGIYQPWCTAALGRQRPDGSWPAGDGPELQGGDTYATAMSILALAVPLGYLPIYQR